jgi:predicted metal-binding membrane protein
MTSSGLSIAADGADAGKGLVGEWTFLATCAALFVASAAVTIYVCRSMSGAMPMPGGWTMSMAWMRMAGQTRAAAAASFMGMWAVMMLAMMLPSLMPMLLRYRRAIRGQAGGHLGTATTIAAAGYFGAWIVLGAVVYPVGVSLTAVTMQWPVLMRLVPVATGIVLLLAGMVQLTSWKARQLRLCRDASGCGSRSAAGVTVWQHGLRLGVDCVLCCAAFMSVLLVTDVMSLTNMAVITVAITLERVARNPEVIARVFGVAIMGFGLLTIVRQVIK